MRSIFKPLALAILLLATGCATRLLDGGAGDAAADGARDQGGGCDGGCPMGLTCCGGVCANVANDIFNCGTCGTVCSGPHPFCQGGSCTQAESLCGHQRPCSTGTFCCGATCCPEGTLCCEVPGPGPTSGPRCVSPTENHGTCPVGCPLCQ